MLAAKALTAISKYGRIDSETTLNTGLLNGGVAFNVVAPEAKCAIDIRSLSVEKVNRMKDETFRILKAVVEECGGKFDAEIHEGCPSGAPQKRPPLYYHCGKSCGKTRVQTTFKDQLRLQ